MWGCDFFLSCSCSSPQSDIVDITQGFYSSQDIRLLKEWFAGSEALRRVQKVKDTFILRHYPGSPGFDFKTFYSPKQQQQKKQPVSGEA